MEQLDPLLRAPEGERVRGGVLGDPDVGLGPSLLLRREVFEYARHPEGSILLHGSSSSIYRLSGMPSSSFVGTVAPSIESGRLAFAQQLESRQQQAGSTATVPPVLSCTAHPTNTLILHTTVLETRDSCGRARQHTTHKRSRHLTLPACRARRRCAAVVASV